MTVQPWMWIAFNVFVLAMLAVDLLVFHRKSHEVSIREAIGWSVLWVLVALAFGGVVWKYGGEATSLAFLTGYLIERSLSVDNLFVFLLIFSFFRVPAQFQHKVLFWGIVGALLMRAILIFAGVSLIHRYEWIIYVFGAFLVYSGLKMLRSKDTHLDPERNPVYRLICRSFRLSPTMDGDRFFTVIGGRRFATPLLLVLAVVETTDLVFALDSIPAVLAVSRDPFIVYTSNVFAILGLRAMYFAVAGLMEMFYLLHYGLSFILIFVGAKMLASHKFDIPVVVTLVVVGGALALSVAASLLYPLKGDPLPEPVDPIEHDAASAE
jgi:tellurite resistance protein TerC